jgi:hypothetical protein
MAKGVKTGGRKKGTPNKSRLDLQEMLDQVFAQVDPVQKLIRLLNKPMDAGVEARVLLRLLEYRYGQPTQAIKLDTPIKFSVGAIGEETMNASSASTRVN